MTESHVIHRRREHRRPTPQVVSDCSETAACVAALSPATPKRPYICHNTQHRTPHRHKPATADLLSRRLRPATDIQETCTRNCFKSSRNRNLHMCRSIL